MKSFDSFAAAAAEFERAALASVVSEQATLDAIGKLVAGRARAKFGIYQDGWEPLAQYTMDERVYLGFTPNDPLLRTGGLRDSIGYDADLVKVTIGSTHDFMVHHEYGTRTHPARPVLVPAVRESLPEILALARGMVVAVFDPDGKPVT